MKVDALLKTMVEAEASDLYLTFGVAPAMLVHGEMQHIGDGALTESDIEAFLAQCISPENLELLKTDKELNVAYANDESRFRLNAFQQRGRLGCVFRHIKTEIPNFDGIGLPEACRDLVMQERGLVLLTGSTGSGKSTSMAALIGHRNAERTGHIVLIEDPIEFIHRHRKSIITQREVGIDTQNYGEALKNTLRQAPDVIVIGEIRDQSTMEYAINFAETGHLCLSTLHANNANQALDRIINFFPEERRQQLLLDLSLNLRGIVSQRLIPSKDGKRALCAEVMIVTPLISDLIRQGNISELKDAMHKAEIAGMQTFDDALYQLVKDDKIEPVVALQHADSENNLRLRLKLDEDAGSSDNLKLKD